VQKNGIEQIERAGQETVRQLTGVGESARLQVEQLLVTALGYASLREEAATLGEYVLLARVLQSDDPEVWRGLSRDLVKHLMAGLVIWSQRAGRRSGPSG